MFRTMETRTVFPYKFCFGSPEGKLSNTGFHGTPWEIHELSVKCHCSVVDFERSPVECNFRVYILRTRTYGIFYFDSVFFETYTFPNRRRFSFLSDKFSSQLRWIGLNPPPRRSLVLVHLIWSIATSDFVYGHITLQTSSRPLTLKTVNVLSYIHPACRFGVGGDRFCLCNGVSAHADTQFTGRGLVRGRSPGVSKCCGRLYENCTRRCKVKRNTVSQNSSPV